MAGFDRKMLNFLLKNVHQVNTITTFDYYSAHDEETFQLILDTAENLAAKHLSPAFVNSDRNEPQLLNDEVKVHPALKPYIQSIAESGLIAATLPFEEDGQQLPKTIYAAAHYILTASHNSFVMFSDLAHGCLEMISTFGTADLKKIYLPKISTCEWLGTMCLTEPQAGSSLSDVQTMAYLQPDGTYKLLGQKVFISAGDHDLTGNIVHLVLARIEGAPAGTKGISLFVVPKYKVDYQTGDLLLENGEKVSNDVKSIAIFHKMGQKATPAMHLGFGGNNDCEGILLGQENKGLAHMFQMMNGARLGVGMTGISIASAAMQLSQQYARERVQGRLPVGSRFPVQIQEHPDVKRMLFAQKAIVNGGLSLLLQCYKYLDLLKVSETEQDIFKYDCLTELLTPVAKTFGAEMGILSTNLGLQIHGGYGYTMDFELEQLARDVRITSIYEGTTGIHSLALVGREILKSDGISLKFWQTEVENTVEEARKLEQTQKAAEQLQSALELFNFTTNKMKEMSEEGKTMEYLADANLYMELFGILNIAWQWLLIGVAATAENGDGKDKLKTLYFYYQYELGKIDYLSRQIINTEKLTLPEI